MKPIPFEYYAPSTLDEALDNVTSLGYDCKVLAGGQSLIPTMNFRMARPAALVDLNNVPELQYIRPTTDGGLAIGTMTRDSKVEKSPEVRSRFPLFDEVMPCIAHPAIRNRGTFGGAIAHADPAGQLPAISLALNASMKILKKGGERCVNAEDFFLGPFMTEIQPDEMLAEVTLPALPKGTGTSYKQVSRQKGGYAQAAVATVVTLDPSGKCTGLRMALISLAELPLLSKEAPRLLVGQKITQEGIQEVAERVSKSEIDPGTDVHGTADYRRQLCRVLIIRSLNEALARAAN